MTSQFHHVACHKSLLHIVTFQNKLGPTLSLNTGLNFLSKTCGNVKVFLHKTEKKFPTKNRKRLMLDDFLRKLWKTGSIERTVMIDFEMCCLYVVLVLPGSVETQLG